MKGAWSRQRTSTRALEWIAGVFTAPLQHFKHATQMKIVTYSFLVINQIGTKLLLFHKQEKESFKILA